MMHEGSICCHPLRAPGMAADELAPAPMSKALKHASSLMDRCSDEACGFCAMPISESVSVPAALSAGAVIVLPAFEHLLDQPIVIDFLAPNSHDLQARGRLIHGLYR
jgi:hypothetical protein